MVTALAAIVALDVGLVYAEEMPGGSLNPDLDRISSLSWTSGGTQLSIGGGFDARPGAVLSLVLTDSNCLLGCAALNFSGATAIPATFVVVATDLPVIAPGATGNLTVTVRAPASQYSGPLSIELSAS